MSAPLRGLVPPLLACLLAACAPLPAVSQLEGPSAALSFASDASAVSAGLSLTSAASSLPAESSVRVSVFSASPRLVLSFDDPGVAAALTDLEPASAAAGEARAIRFSGAPADVAAAVASVSVRALPEAALPPYAASLVASASAPGDALGGAADLTVPVDVSCPGGAPALQSAEMDGTATGALLFDRAVHAAEDAACDALVAGADLGEGARCWVDGAALRFALGAGASPSLGDALGAVNGSVAACEGGTGPAADPAVTSALAAAAAASLAPSVSLRASAVQMPACATTVRLLVAAEGLAAGGTVTLGAAGATLGAGEDSVEPGVPHELDVTGWAEGADVTLTVTANGPWGQSSAASLVLRRLASDSAPPVSVSGPARREHDAAAGLVLEALSDYSGACGGPAGAACEWASSSPEPAGWADAAGRELTVPAGAMDAGQSYTFTVTCGGDGANSSQASATVDAFSRAAEAVRGERTVTTADPVALEAAEDGGTWTCDPACSAVPAAGSRAGAVTPGGTPAPGVYEVSAGAGGLEVTVVVLPGGARPAAPFVASLREAGDSLEATAGGLEGSAAVWTLSPGALEAPGGAVPAASLEGGLEYRLRLSTADSGGADEVPVSVRAAPASTGSASALPAEGTSLDTGFTLSAAGFDRAADARPLLYRFYQAAPGRDAVALAPASLSPHLEGALLASGATVEVRVSDTDGGRYASAAAAVNVSLPDGVAYADLAGTFVGAVSDALAADSAALPSVVASAVAEGAQLRNSRERGDFRTSLLAVLAAGPVDRLLPAADLAATLLATVRVREKPSRGSLDLALADAGHARTLAEAAAAAPGGSGAGVSRDLLAAAARAFDSVVALRDQSAEGRVVGKLSDEDEALRLAAAEGFRALSEGLVDGAASALSEGESATLPEGAADSHTYLVKAEAVAAGAAASNASFGLGTCTVSWPAAGTGAGAVRVASYWEVNPLSNEVSGAAAGADDGAEVSIRTAVAEVTLAGGDDVALAFDLQASDLAAVIDSDRVSVLCVRWDADASVWVEDAASVATGAYDADRVACTVLAAALAAGSPVTVAAEVVVRPATPPSSAELPSWGVGVLVGVGVVLLAVSSVVSYKLCTHQTVLTRSQTISASRKTFHSLASNNDIRARARSEPA